MAIKEIFHIKTVVEIYEETLGKDHPRVDTRLSSLGRFYYFY